MATEALKKFADELKSVRLAKEISLKQIASKTKIDVKFLQAIEDANFDILPEIYIRAFIKEFVQAIDQGSIDILQKFDKAKSGNTDEKQLENTVVNVDQGSQEESVNLQNTASSKEFDSTELPSAPVKVEVKSGIKLNYVLGASVLLIAVFIIYFAFFSDTSPEIIQEKINQESVSENNQRFQIDNSAQVQNVTQSQNLLDKAQSAPDSLRLSIQTSDRVWIKVSVDGKTVHQQVFQANSKLNFAATKSFSVSVGNAGLVKMFFNGKPVENVGKPGEVRNIFMTADNVRYYTIAPQVKNEQKSPKQN